MANNTGISQEVQNRYLKYVDDMDDLMYSNPNFRFYIGFDNQQLMLRLFVRNAMHLDKIVRHFREIDQSSFFTGQREPAYQYAVSPFGFFPSGLLFDILNYVVNEFELNPMKLSSSQLVFIGPKAKLYIYDYLLPLAGKMSALHITRENFGPNNISMERAEDPSSPSVRVMRPYQEDAITQIIFKGNGRCLIQSPTGCHAAGTNILMWDGSSRKVEDILDGDLVFGDDGTPRQVLSRCHGKAQMFRIVPETGTPFVVNGEHVLSLVFDDVDYVAGCNMGRHEETDDGMVIDIPVLDYLSQPEEFKTTHVLYRSTKAFPDMDCSRIRTRFTVEPMDVMDYYGFNLDGNHRYVLADDGFVTHNSGKSFIIANLIYTLQRQFFAGETFRTLIYVPNIQLVEQFYKDLLEYGYRPDEVCRFSGSTKPKDRQHILTADIVIANSTYCLQHISEIGKIDMVIGDEAHKTFNHGTAGFSVLENFLIETKLRVGLSGTLPKGFKFHQMVGLTGPKVFDTSVSELQEQGFISECSITRLNIEVSDVMRNRELLFHPNSIYKVNSVDETGMGLVGSGDPYRAEQKFMVDNCERLFQPVLDYITTETTLKDNAIILFDRTEMGERLYNHLSLLHERKEIDRMPLFIDGSIPLAERERVRKFVEDNTGCLLVGQSAILSTGINIKSLSKLVLFVGGKSMARTIQSIGRILRLKEGKEAECIDVCYSMKYSKRHQAERKRLYREFYNKDKFDKVVDITI